MSQELGVETKRKREELNIMCRHARHRRKRMRKDTKSMEQRVDSIDRFSELPDYVIHQILGLLRCTKDAARTSVLSKRWRDIWASFLNLVFDQRKFQKGKTLEMFVDHVNTTLQRHVEQKNIIERFVLHMTCYSSEFRTRVDRCIDLALKLNIQELYLHVPGDKISFYSLPQCVFAANRITALRVYGCKLELGHCNNLNLPNLKKLCLGKQSVNEQIIEKLICSCPELEDFRLIYCTGLKTFQVSNLPKLIRVDLHTCKDLKKVNLQVPNLESFWYHGWKYVSCRINLSTCNSLKSLTLEDANLKDDSFQNHLSCFPILENLVLSKCNALKNITISSYRLKTLILRECKQLKEADIDTPNLVLFEYKGDKMPFTSLNPSSLKEAKLHFESSKDKEGYLNGDDHSDWFRKLQEFLEKFDYSKGLKLVACSNKNVVIYEKPKKIFLPQVYGLKLDVVKSSITLEDLLDDILRAWRPETLSSLSISKSNLPKIVHNKLIAREKEPSCCTYNVPNNKCWRHFLDNVKSVNLVNCKSTSEWIDWLKSSRAMFKANCFVLSWKPRKHVTQG